MIFLYLPRQREKPPDDRLSESTTDHRMGYTPVLLPCDRITPHPKVSHLREIRQINPNASRQDYYSEEPLPPVQESTTGTFPAVPPPKRPGWSRSPTRLRTATPV